MNDIGTKVKIKLVSKIIPTDGELETYEMWLQGSLINKSGSNYLRYEEVQEEHTVQTTIKLNNDQAFIMRSGGISMRLPLNKKQLENGHYENMYGSLPIVTKTNELSHERINDTIEGRFYAQYDLIVNGASVGNYTLDIHYSEGQS